jgi:hypothetical protein
MFKAIGCVVVLVVIMIVTCGACSLTDWQVSEGTWTATGKVPQASAPKTSSTKTSDTTKPDNQTNTLFTAKGAGEFVVGAISALVQEMDKYEKAQTESLERNLVRNLNSDINRDRTRGIFHIGRDSSKNENRNDN